MFSAANPRGRFQSSGGIRVPLAGRGGESSWTGGRLAAPSKVKSPTPVDRWRGGFRSASAMPTAVRARGHSYPSEPMFQHAEAGPVDRWRGGFRSGWPRRPPLPDADISTAYYKDSSPMRITACANRTKIGRRDFSRRPLAISATSRLRCPRERGRATIPSGYHRSWSLANRWRTASCGKRPGGPACLCPTAALRYRRGAAWSARG